MRKFVLFLIIAIGFYGYLHLSSEETLEEKFPKIRAQLEEIKDILMTLKEVTEIRGLVLGGQEGTQVNIQVGEYIESISFAEAVVRFRLHEKDLLRLKRIAEGFGSASMNIKNRYVVSIALYSGGVLGSMGGYLWIVPQHEVSPEFRGFMYENSEGIQKIPGETHWYIFRT